VQVLRAQVRSAVRATGAGFLSAGGVGAGAGLGITGLVGLQVQVSFGAGWG
jgi:hypothetical protein